MSSNVSTGSVAAESMWGWGGAPESMWGWGGAPESV